MEYVSKKDFSFYQNEILKELKSRDIKINEQIKQSNFELNKQQQSIEQKIDSYNQKLDILIKNSNDDKFQTAIKQEFENFKKIIELKILQQSTKISTTEKDLFDARIKYDRVISNQEFIPGLIGKSCKFPALKNFFEYVDKKLTELILFKDKTSTDFKLYKEKLGSMLEQFRLQIANYQNDILANVSESFTKNENNCKERITVIEDRISQMRIENGKYCYDLMKKTEDLIKEWEKIENIKNEISEKLDTELNKYKDYNEGLIKLFNGQKDEFKIIKVRFTELSDFLKDVRFKKNLKLITSQGKEYNDVLENKYNYRNLVKMSKKLNFNKKQKLNKDEQELFEKVKYEGECNMDINLAEKKNIKRNKKIKMNQFLNKTPKKSNIDIINNKTTYKKNSVNIQKIKTPTHQSNSKNKINENLENDEIEENDSFSSDENEGEENSYENKENNNMSINKKNINNTVKDNETILSDEIENNKNNNKTTQTIKTECKSFLFNKASSYESNNNINHNHSRNNIINNLYNSKEDSKITANRIFKSEQKIHEHRIMDVRITLS